MNDVLFSIEVPKTFEVGLFIGFLTGVIIAIFSGLTD